MIVLCGFDPNRNRAQIQSFDLDLGIASSSPESMQRLAKQLGVGEVEFSELALSESVAHRWLADDRLHYYASFPAHRESVRDFTRYLGVALCTIGSENIEALRRMHVALHELAANSLEHGTAIRANPNFRIQLSVTPDVIEGTLVDDCLPFNPLDMEAVTIGERIALRASRGYGITLARRLLDSLDYADREGGNEIRFRQLLR